MEKTIFVLLDGCSYESATQHMGYMEHLCEQGKGSKYKVCGQLPAMSRPMYETLFTGLPVYKHKVTHNDVERMSDKESIFSLCQKENLTTAASAYFWVSELYQKSPFNKVTDRFSLDGRGAINYGLYYYEDTYPDQHVFSEGEWLRTTYHPDFLLIHTMNIDDVGHKEGGTSSAYYKRVMAADVMLAQYMDTWLSEGYAVVVTADHGMNEWGFHCGKGEADRMVPLYIFSNRYEVGDFTNITISQLEIAPLICNLLGMSMTHDMRPETKLEVKKSENEEK